MPMGTEVPGEIPTRDPKAPAGGTLMTPAQIQERRAELQEQMAILNQLTVPADIPTDNPPDAPARPVAAVNLLEPHDEIPAQYPIAPQPPVPVPAPADTPQDAVKEPGEFSHWLHLADGRVVKSLGTYTQHFEDDNPLSRPIPVVASVANPNYQPGTGDVISRRKALIAELKALGLDLSVLFNQS